MSSTEIIVNGVHHLVDADDDTPLLWVIRDILGLTGTKYGCGEGSCGACTVLEADEPVRSCQTNLSEAAGLSYTTIEGFAEKPGADACQSAWVEEEVSQCGYCQAGFLLEVWALLGRKPEPTDDLVEKTLNDHICRCGTYPRIRRAIRRAASSRGGK
ncbi:MAG: (2Fe-2S)-binding protein [Candidatus Eisenbacteria bacterium]|uniref:(2Fe-2S)-binding protein n=1 Tax=Eiseniibacteriota bacterium TaxID=2212470 RepID=A0A956RNW1_UNCEI|nr:(2Fe-2S)-binding protein [Candidatus Eisenbacteria bacterium]